MKRSDWFRCLEKDYSYKEFTFDKFSGIVSSSKLKKLTGPLVIHYEMGDVLLADDNYTWLQLAFRDECFWLTAMYDDKDNLIQLYFDITKGNFFEEEDNPYFYDMFLDVVVTKEGRIVILDEDELKMALENNIISVQEYQEANNIVKELVSYLEKNKDNLIKYCYQLLQEMK